MEVASDQTTYFKSLLKFLLRLSQVSHLDLWLLCKRTDKRWRKPSNCVKISPLLNRFRIHLYSNLAAICHILQFNVTCCWCRQTLKNQTKNINPDSVMPEPESQSCYKRTKVTNRRDQCQKCLNLAFLALLPASSRRAVMERKNNLTELLSETEI